MATAIIKDRKTLLAWCDYVILDFSVWCFASHEIFFKKAFIKIWK